MRKQNLSWLPYAAVALVILASAAKGAAAPAPAKPPTNQRPLLLGELVALARRVGFPDPELAAAVAMAESGGNAGAVGDNGTSFGLWQIHTPVHPQFSPQSMLDPTSNALAAFAISSQGTNWHPWTTFNTGAYKQFYRSKANA